MLHGHFHTCPLASCTPLQVNLNTGVACPISTKVGGRVINGNFHTGGRCEYRLCARDLERHTSRPYCPFVPYCPWPRFLRSSGKVPASFEPGHSALTAAIAISAAQNGAGGGGGSGGGGGPNAQPPTPGAGDIDMSTKSSSAGGKATTPSTPAEGGWTGNGGVGVGGGDKRSELRVTSEEQKVQVS